MFSLRLWIPAVLAVLSTTPSSAAIPSFERSALDAVYSSTNGAQWRAKEGWQGPAGTECTWRGATARVRVTVTYADVGSVVSASRIGILEFALEPNAFLLISNLADLIGQASASADLRNVQLKFQLISGEGAVIPFTSSVDNGTADQVFRVE